MALSNGGLSRVTARELQMELAHLKGQLQTQQKILDRMDRSPAFGWIDAANHKHSQAFQKQYGKALERFVTNPDHLKDPSLRSLIEDLRVTDKSGKLDLDKTWEKFFDRYYLSQPNGNDRFQLNRLTQTGTDNPNPQLQLRPGEQGFDIVKHSDAPDAGGAARYVKNGDGTERVQRLDRAQALKHESHYLKEMQKRGHDRQPLATLEAEQTKVRTELEKWKQKPGNYETKIKQLEQQERNLSRQMGEQSGEMAVLRQHPNAVLEYGGASSKSQAGDFDQVWRIPGERGQPDRFVVVEAKGGSSPLGTRWAKDEGGKSIRAEQGSRPYFNSVRKEMGGEGKSQQSVNIADDLSTALDDNNVEYWHVKAPLDKDPSQLKSIEVREFDLS
jgi:hypothetical protein